MLSILNIIPDTVHNTLDGTCTIVMKIQPPQPLNLLESHGGIEVLGCF